MFEVVFCINHENVQLPTFKKHAPPPPQQQQQQQQQQRPSRSKRVLKARGVLHVYYSKT